MGHPTEDIEVVVHHDEVPAAAPVRRSRHAPRAAVALAVGLLVVVGGPVIEARPVDEVAGPSADATCKWETTRRLWCSFAGDEVCCPPD